MPPDLDPRRLLHLLAVHPVLPPADALPANDEALRALVADLAKGSASDQAGLLDEVSRDRAIPGSELARRAQFLLACLVLPAAGSHYEVLGVAPDATGQEIRKRWAEMIQRYHPDHFGGARGGTWLNGQARRLIEAYQTLKDPAQRAAYDATRAQSSAAEPRRVLATVSRPTTRWRSPLVGPWRWAPAGIVAVGVAAGAWVASRPAPLPPAPVPPAPKLLGRAAEPAAPLAPDSGRASAGRPPGSREARAPAAASGDGVGPPPLAGRVAERRAPPVSAAPARETPSRPAGRAPGPAERGGPAPETRPAARAEGLGWAPTVAVADPAPQTAASRPPEAAAVPSPVAVGPAPAPASSGAGVPAPAPPPAPRSAGSPPALAAPALPAAPHEELLGVIEAFRSAYERRNVPVLMGLFGAAPRDRMVAGRRAVEALYARNFAALGEIRYELSRLEVVPTVSAGQFVVEGRYRIFATENGFVARRLELTGPIRWVLGREPGGLRILAVDYEVPPR